MIPSADASFFVIQAAGIRCKLCSLGASIVSVEVPNRNGTFLNIALSPQNFEFGHTDPSLAGRTIAPCCGRVRGGKVVIEGVPLQLEQNEGSNHLHGGTNGCAAQIWHSKQFSPSHVRFSLTLPDGFSGYPGTRTLQADYISSDHCLQVTYTATTDRPTWIDMTNHIYWDLSGKFDGSAMEQLLQIAADRVVFNDPQHLPQCIVPTSGTPFDFSSPISPVEQIRKNPCEEQFSIGRGYNNAYLLSPEMQQACGFSARLASHHTGIQMTMQTDQPAIVFYSGGFLDDKTQLYGRHAFPGCALALEAQQMPDPFHLPGAKPTILHSHQKWQRQIIWKFSRE